MGPSSTSEPKLHSSNRRLAGARFKVSGESNGADDEMVSVESKKRLQRMKAQSKKTFKFRKTRRRNLDDPTSANIDGVIIEQSSPPETSTTTTQTPSTSCISTSIASSAQRKSSTTMKPVR